MIEHTFSSPKGPWVRMPATRVVECLHLNHPIEHARFDRLHEAYHCLTDGESQLTCGVFRMEERIGIRSLAGAGRRCGFSDLADLFWC